MEQLREGGFLISKIHQLSARIFAKLLNEFNIKEINPAQGRVMFPLWRKDNMSFQELRKKTSLSKATLSHMLDNLEKAGYLIRVRSEKDKRTMNVKLTKKNKSLQEKYLKVSNKMTNIFYDGLSENEIDKFEKYLKLCLENLTKFDENRIK